MSLSVYLVGEEKDVECKCPMCDHAHTRKDEEIYFSRNITHNLGLMARKTADEMLYKALWRPEENGIKTAVDLMPHLEKGLSELKQRPKFFKQFNPENKWGSYEGLVNFCEDLLYNCMAFPHAIVEASR